MNTLLLAAAIVSEATWLTVGKMPVEPTADNNITVEEECSANVQYGAMSSDTLLMATRYAVFHIGFADKGVYFATRTSTPKSPQTLNADDTVELTLLPPGRKEPLRYTFCLAEKARMLKGLKDFGVTCCEFETLVPYGDVPRPKPGEKWGFNMAVSFSSEKEKAYFHLPKRVEKVEGVEGDKNSQQPTTNSQQLTEELATLAYEPDMPSFSLVHFGECEEWRASGNLGAIYRFAAPKVETAVASKSFIVHGLGFSKLDSEPEKNVDIVRTPVKELSDVKLAADETKEIFHREWNIWSGSVAVLSIDLAAGGKPLCRRVLRWDLNNGKDWKDAEGLPSINFAFYPALTNFLRVCVSPNDVQDIVRAGVRVVGSKGNVVWQKALDCSPHLQRTVVDQVLGKLPYDDYTLSFAGENAAGRKYRHDRTFSVKHFAWQDAHLGEDRGIIVAPFKPIEVEKRGGGGQRTDKISFLQTGYRCGGVLWDEVYAKGENILAAPMALKLNGREFTVTNVRFVEQSPDRVVREVTAKIQVEGGRWEVEQRNGKKSTVQPSTCNLQPASLTLVLTQDYDYDGYCWTTLKFDAAEPVEVRELKLVVPFKAKYLKYYQTLCYTNDRSGPAPDITLPTTNGVVWTSTTGWDPSQAWYSCRDNYCAPIQPLVWFGGYQKGLTWFMESFRGTSYDYDIVPQRLVRKDDVATFEVDLVNKPTTWKGANEIQMGFQPSPVKPKDPHAYACAGLMYSYSCPSNAVFQRGTGDRAFYYNANTMPVLTFPGDDPSFVQWTFAQRKRDTQLYREKLREYCDKHADWFRANRLSPNYYYGVNQTHDRNMGTDTFFVYMNPKHISSYWPEWEMYKSEWWPLDWCEDDYFNEYMGCDSKSRVDKLMWDLKKALEIGFEGMMYDCYTHWPNKSLASGDAYLRPDGSIQCSMGEIRGWRSIMRRSAILCHKMGKTLFGRPYVINHDTHGAVTPVMGFCASGDSGERGGNGGEFPVRFCESFTLVNIVGAHIGKSSAFCVSTQKGDRARQEREVYSLLGYMCAYGVFYPIDQGLTHGCPWFDKAWNVPFDYGWGRPETVTHHTFWDEEFQPVTHTGKNVRLSVAEKKGKEALLMFGNLGDAEEVTFDVSGLGLGNVKLTDHETGEELAEPKLHIGRFGYRYIRVEKR